jgi:phage FluMu protein Com
MQKGLDIPVVVITEIKLIVEACNTFSEWMFKRFSFLHRNWCLWPVDERDDRTYRCLDLIIKAGEEVVPTEKCPHCKKDNVQLIYIPEGSLFLSWENTCCKDRLCREKLENKIPGKKEVTELRFSTELLLPEGEKRSEYSRIFMRANGLNEDSSPEDFKKFFLNCFYSKILS